MAAATKAFCWKGVMTARDDGLDLISAWIWQLAGWGYIGKILLPKMPVQPRRWEDQP